MNREDLDLHTVRPEHFDVHNRCLNWARYVTPGRGGAGCHPMFRQYRSSDVWAAAQGIEADSLDGHAMEKAVGKLPEKHRDAIRWVYVFFHIHPGKMCRHLAVSRSGLAALIHDGRSMLSNRTRHADCP